MHTPPPKNLIRQVRITLGAAVWNNEAGRLSQKILDEVEEAKRSLSNASGMDVIKVILACQGINLIQSLGQYVVPAQVPKASRNQLTSNYSPQSGYRPKGAVIDNSADYGMAAGRNIQAPPPEALEADDFDRAAEADDRCRMDAAEDLLGDPLRN